MAFGDKPTAPVKGSAAAFTEKLRRSAAEYKGNGYSTTALPVERSSDLGRAEFKPLRWAVPNFVPEGITLLAGPKGRGKSFIVLDWALAVARGGSALGCVPCEPGAVLYLALEDSRRRIKERQTAILQGRPEPDALDLAYEWKPLDQGGQAAIEGWIASRDNPRLVIVDVLAKVKGSPDRAKGVYDQDYATITPLHKLARDEGIPILIVHHTNKGAADDPVMRVSGTMGLTGACDTVLVLERPVNSPMGELYVRGRDVPERSVALQFDALTGCCTLLGPADDYRKSEERREIIRLLLETGVPMTPVDIARETGRKRPTVRSLLARLLKADEVGKLPNGKYYAIRKT